jgi:hypothetical protein
VAQHLFSLDSHSMFSREQMIYYQNHLALSMMILKNNRRILSAAGTLSGGTKGQ